MFNISKKINQVKFYRLNDYSLVYLDSLNNINTGDKSICSLNSSIDGFEFFKNHIYINDWNGIFEVYDLNLNKVEKGEGKAFFFSSTFNLGYQYLNERGQIIEGLIRDKEIIDLGAYLKFNNINFSNNNFYFFLNETNSIIAISIYDKKNIWNFKQDSIKEIKKLLGIWQSELLVACSDGLLISIDIETGTLKRSWQEIPDSQFDSVIQNRIPKMEIFSLHGDTLIGALHIYYFELDLKTGEIKIENLEEELKKHTIFHIKQTNENPITETHIYLTAMMRQPDGDTKFSYDCLITLNRQTFKIDWQYKFEEESLGTNIPKLSGDKLYQLDNGGTLHIFEKEV